MYIMADIALYGKRDCMGIIATRGCGCCNAGINARSEIRDPRKVTLPPGGEHGRELSSVDHGFASLQI